MPATIQYDPSLVNGESWVALCPDHNWSLRAATEPAASEAARKHEADLHSLNGKDPDWAHLYQLNHHFRAVSVAVGDRRKPLNGWRVFGYIGEHESAQGTLHGPWRPTQVAALRAVYRRGIRIGRIPRGSA